MRERDQADSLVLALFEIAQFFDRRILMSRAGAGDFTIIEELRSAYHDLKPSLFPKRVSAHDIIEIRRESRAKIEELGQVYSQCKRPTRCLLHPFD